VASLIKTLTYNHDHRYFDVREPYSTTEYGRFNSFMRKMKHCALIEGEHAPFEMLLLADCFRALPVVEDIETSDHLPMSIAVRHDIYEAPAYLRALCDDQENVFLEPNAQASPGDGF
jgi:hypothetical protein